jgi:hypothetical protein
MIINDNNSNNDNNNIMIPKKTSPNKHCKYEKNNNVVTPNHKLSQVITILMIATYKPSLNW